MDPVRVKTIETSANLFSVFGAGTQVGEGFPAAARSSRTPLDRRDQRPSVAHAVRRRSGGHRQATHLQWVPYGGRRGPAGFRFPGRGRRVATPEVGPDTAQPERTLHGGCGAACDGISLEQARGAANRWRRGSEQSSNSNKGWAFGVVPLLDDQLGYYRPALYVPVWRGRSALCDRLSERGLAAADPGAVARAGNCGADGARRRAPADLTQLLAESLILSVFGAVAGVLVALAALPASLPSRLSRCRDWRRRRSTGGCWRSRWAWSHG